MGGHRFGGEDGALRSDWAPLGGAAGDKVEATRLGMAATEYYHWRSAKPGRIYAVGAVWRWRCSAITRVFP